MVSPGGWLEFCFVMRHFGSSDLSDYGTEPGLGGCSGDAGMRGCGDAARGECGESVESFC